MNIPSSKKKTCNYCTNERDLEKPFCNYCGRDQFLGIKKWEYLFGVLSLMIIIPIATMSVNLAIKYIKSVPSSPTQAVVQFLPTIFSPSPQNFESYTSTPVSSTPTPTLIPTEIISTSVPIPTVCPEITITITDTPKGDILHIERCSDGWKYDTSPIAKGAYGLAPNNKFIIYCTNTGDVYAVKIGDPNFKFIETIRKRMPIFHKNDDVSLIITFILGENQYWAKIADQISRQNTTVKIPLKISQ